MDHYQRVLNIMESGNNADIIYLDFAKAFDKVDHGILLRKLARIGVGGKILAWIYQFLLNRRQVVKVENESSPCAEVVSGVPQGTVLGPILFLIFVEDIDKDLEYAIASSFADDTRVMMEVGDSNQHASLQQDLEKLYSWSNENNMMFNGGKFQHLRYGPSHDGRRYTSPDGEFIAIADEVKDLGISMSGKGDFESQVNGCVLKGNRVAGQILRAFKTRDPKLLMMLYKALVQPIVEYCCQIWSPKKLYLIKKLESVQRHNTAKIAGTSGMNYRERLNYLELYSLERRRDRHVIIYGLENIAGACAQLAWQ